MDQALDTRLQLDERPVGHHVNNLARHTGINRVFLFHSVPGIRLLLFQAQRDLLVFAVDIQDHDFNLLVNRDHLRRMAYPLPAHVRDMQQAIEAPEIHKGTKVGNVLYHTLADLLDLQRGEQCVTIFLSLFFYKGTPADDDIPSSLVNLEYFTFHFLSNEITDIIRPTDIHLACREKHIDSDIDKQAALDLAVDQALHDLPFLDMLHHLRPGQYLGSLPLAQRHHPVLVAGPAKLVFEFLDENLECLTCFGRIFIRIPFIDVNGPLALEAHVHDGKFVIDPDNGPFNDIVDREIGFRFQAVIKRIGPTLEKCLQFLGKRVVFKIAN